MLVFKSRGIGERLSMKGVSDGTGDIVRERLGWDGVGYELAVFGLKVRVVWVGVNRSEGIWAGSAHSE